MTLREYYAGQAMVGLRIATTFQLTPPALLTTAKPSAAAKV